MNEIIKTTKSESNGETVMTCDARELWEFLESKQDFSTWMKNRISKYDFKEGKDYLLHKIVEQLPSGRKYRVDYRITLDMAKELAMVENNERGKQARQYFIEAEKRWRKSITDVDSIFARIEPIIRENERQRAQLELAKNFLPLGKPGDLNKNGVPKTQFRRGCYVSGKGRNVAILMENPNLPGIFEEIPVRMLN